jgi:hypothetical protein
MGENFDLACQRLGMEALSLANSWHRRSTSSHISCSEWLTTRLRVPWPDRRIFLVRCRSCHFKGQQLWIGGRWVLEAIFYNVTLCYRLSSVGIFPTLPCQPLHSSNIEYSFGSVLWKYYRSRMISPNLTLYIYNLESLQNSILQFISEESTRWKEGT